MWEICEGDGAGAQAVSKGSGSWVLCESCIWGCIKEQVKWPYLVLVYSQFSVINYNSPTKFLIRKQSAYPNYLFLSPSTPLDRLLWAIATLNTPFFQELCPSKDCHYLFSILAGYSMYRPTVKSLIHWGNI